MGYNKKNNKKRNVRNRRLGKRTPNMKCQLIQTDEFTILNNKIKDRKDMCERRITLFTNKRYEKLIIAASFTLAKNFYCRAETALKNKNTELAKKLISMGEKLISCQAQYSYLMQS